MDAEVTLAGASIDRTGAEDFARGGGHLEWIQSVKWIKNIFGGSTMATLAAGKTAPDFTLSTMDGKKFSLREALARGPVVAVFFKISCPVCQYALPFLERIYRAHSGKGVTFVGISQNGKKDTAAFLKEYGVTFPVLLDDTSTYPVSNAYGLTNVPTTFWIATDGKIEISSVGWVRSDVEDINRRAAEAAGGSFQPVFQPGEQVADFRAG
jgi:cytochrome c biogenesis protein CcmG/thiol:disulfide interchange protein DsbE